MKFDKNFKEEKINAENLYKVNKFRVETSTVVEILKESENISSSAEGNNCQRAYSKHNSPGRYSLRRKTQKVADRFGCFEERCEMA